MKVSLWMACLAALLAAPWAARAEEGLVAGTSLEAHYYSRAVIQAYAWGKPGEVLKGGQILVDGVLQGPSPAKLAGFFMDKPAASLQVQLDGYRLAYRPAVALPREGLVPVALLPEHPAAMVTLPATVVGLAACAASLVFFNQSDSNGFRVGTVLLSSGGGLILLTQILSLFHSAHLQSEVDKANARLQP